MGIHVYNTQIFRQTGVIQTNLSKFDKRLFSQIYLRKRPRLRCKYTERCTHIFPFALSGRFTGSSCKQVALIFIIVVKHRQHLFLWAGLGCSGGGEGRWLQRGWGLLLAKNKKKLRVTICCNKHNVVITTVLS